MSLPQRPRKNCVIVLMLFSFLLLPPVCVAQDISASPLSDISEQGVAGRMLVLLEQRANLEKIIAAGEGRIDELLRQLELKNSEIATLEAISKLKDEKIALLESKAAIEQKIEEGKDTLHAAELKAAKPSFIEKMGMYSVGGVIGVIGTALVFIFLL